MAKRDELIKEIAQYKDGDTDWNNPEFTADFILRCEEALTKKGEDLCQAYGEALMKIHGLESLLSEIEKPLRSSFMLENQHGSLSDVEAIDEALQLIEKARKG